ncbi:hypothetical protein IE53DRAFT_369434 [Violaceomyces palustris]|uniref:Uncharacterized protein n=1 Tax=Violaceomyces palustris TaxID=1673888 RepID=A0ACD0NVM5_9BASI|nr:hypothetical protein IE53DRAFT_369434 [Violaceomyces palustris]
MSALPSTQESQLSRQKKNPIGSWFKKFARRGSEQGGQPTEDRDAYANVGESIHHAAQARSSKLSDPDGARKAIKTRGNKGRRIESFSGIPNLAEGKLSAPPPDNLNEINSPESDDAFGSQSAQGLASTLVIPQQVQTPASGGTGSLPPKIEGLPHHEPMNFTSSNNVVQASRIGQETPTDASPSARVGSQSNDAPLAQASQSQREGVKGWSDAPRIDSPSAQALKVEEKNPSIQAAALDYGDSSVQTHRRANSDTDSSSDGGWGGSGEGLGRDSIGNRTMDTGKSRASTKPTTLMSLDMREQALPHAHIAQARHGDPSSYAGAHRNLISGGSAAIQFATSPLGRTMSGGIISLPGQDAPVEEIGPYVNVPSHSRHHPANNPAPSAIPPDNASMLTLASSTAAHSFGGAASSRGGHGNAPSLGGARSIGGSLMGERRNSSDTYASIKALPPLSRRGSDSSSRTRESVAASATGQSSSQAMFSGAIAAGPGAPLDRVSIHRTPSQRTVATQLSIPLSASASTHALHGPGGGRDASTFSAGGSGPAESSSTSRLVAAAGESQEAPISVVNTEDAAAAGSQESETELVSSEAVPTTHVNGQEVISSEGAGGGVGAKTSQHVS